MHIVVSSPEAMELLGSKIANVAFAGMQIHLSGELGAGKTTLVRGFLRGLGHSGTVKSPTYTLVESYNLGIFTLYHFDFYRVKHPDEIEMIGFRDYREDGAICLIEWPEMADQRIGQPDLLMRFKIETDSRTLEIDSCTDEGNSLISKLTL
jgi:tRNA threonylcarbamoyladenosine biosynthesis protein TsaE